MKIELNLSLDTAGKDASEAVNKLIAALEVLKPEEKPKTTRTRKTPAKPKEEAPAAGEPSNDTPKEATPKKETAPKKETTPKEEKPKEEAPAADSSEITIEMVREALAKKVGSHRNDIKAKLTELEAKNVTNLEAAKYPEFLDFLNSL